MKLFQKKVIPGCPNRSPLFTRYTILSCRFGQILLHSFHQSDQDRDLHDHPWAFCAIILRGGYLEVAERKGSGYWFPSPRDGRYRKFHRPGTLLFRPAKWAHCVLIEEGKPVWSLVITGPRVRDWRFHTANGWLQWRKWGRSKGCE